MCHPSGVAYDAGNSRLFVADTGNHRVLAYNVATIANGQNAANVLGEPDFTTIYWGVTTQSRLTQPTGVAYDGSAARLFVVEYGDSRVMVYNAATITNGQNAANVLGQADFTSNGSALTQSGMAGSYGVAYDAGNSRLFVVENSNSRVLVFNAATITNGQNAANVLGQADFTTNSFSWGVTTQSGMASPYGVAYDAGNSRLFVADSGNNRVKVYDFAGAPPGNAQIIGVYPSSFTVTFSTVAGTSEYTLDASTVSDYTGTVYSSVTYVTTLSTLTTPSSLSPNTTYYLRLGAFNTWSTVYTYVTAVGTSTLTNLISPSVLSVTGNTVTVGWPAFTAGPGTNTAQGYQLQASTAADFSGTLYSSATATLTFSTLTVSGLTSGTTYYLRAGGLNWNSVANFALSLVAQTLSGFGNFFLLME